MRSFNAARVPLKVWATIIFFVLTTIAAAGYLPLLHAGMGTSVGGPIPVVSQNFVTSPTLPLWLDVSLITGNRTQYDSTGKLTYAPNNLLTYSNTFSNAAWTKDNVTPSSGVADPVGGTNAWTVTASAPLGSIYQSVSISNASSYRGLNTVWLRRRTGSGTVKLFAPNGATSVVAALTSSWQQFAVSSVGHASGVFYIFVELATSGDAVDVYAPTMSRVTYETTPRSQDQVITTTSAYYGPRFDYDPVTTEPRGLLIEEARTNIVLQSGALTNAAWSFVGITRTTDTTVASDGATLMAKITASSGSGQPQLYTTNAVTIASGSNYAYSVEVKAGASNFPCIILQSSSNDYITAVFDISSTANGTASQTSVGTTSGTIVSTSKTYIGGGRFRLSIVGSIAKTTTYPVISVAIGATGNSFAGGIPNATFLGTESVYCTFAQLEAGSFPTSYIPTTSASVTRAPDIVKLAGDALTTIGGSAGTVIQEYNLEGDTAATQYQIYGNTVSPLYFDSSRVIKATNGTNVLSSAVTATVGTAIRAGLAWDGTGRAISANGSAAQTDANTIGTIGSTVYDGSNNGANTANGWLRTFAIYSSKLSGSTFTTKTTTGGAL